MNRLLVFLSGVAVTLVALWLWNGNEEAADTANARVPPAAASTPNASPFPERRSAGSEAAENQQVPVAPVKPAESQAESIVETAPFLPSWLPAEFNWLSNSPTLMSFERQDLDLPWSAEMENRISEYLANNREIASTYGRPIVACRKTGCKVFVTAYQRGERPLAEAFSASLSDYEQQAWSEQFIGTVDTHDEAGVQTLVWTLARTRN